MHYFYFVLFKIRTQLYIWDVNKTYFRPTFIYLEGHKKKKIRFRPKKKVSGWGFMAKKLGSVGRLLFSPLFFLPKMGIFTRKATFAQFFFEKTEKKFRVGPIFLGSVGKPQPDTFFFWP